MQFSRFALLAAVVSGTLSASAQDVTEAYRLSNLTTQGTARSMGFGNALGSVGGDFSSLSVNPAGLGIYRHSEFTFTPSLHINSASSQYLNTTTADNNTRFNINNFGLVLTSAPKGKRYENRNWKTVSFAFGMNRVADFNRNYTYGGKNFNNSATQAFESDANQYPGDAVSNNPSSVPGYVGYQSYLLNEDTLTGRFHPVVPFSGGINQLKSVQERGHVDEYVISLGGNYKEKLILGATMGLTSVNYELNSSYTESMAAGNNNPNPNNFNSFTYDQSLKISGDGINLKLGAIYKFNDNFRLGLAFHSPTVYSITDVYTPGMISQVNGVQTVLSVDNGTLLQNNYNYSFTTPWKSILSATYIMKGVGFLTADYEYVDYSAMHYSFPADPDYATNVSVMQSEHDMNQSIKNTYQGVSDFRLGAEVFVHKFLMARAGFGYYGNAYKIPGNNSQRLDFSAGLGFHADPFFADIAVVHSQYQGQVQPYTIDYSAVYSGPQTAIPVATTDFSINNVALTVGVKF